MRVLEFLAPKQLAWRDAPDPQLGGDREAIVRPIASTTCDLDHAIVAGRTPLPPPFALGHECVAEVVAIGDAVKTVRPGAVVVVPWHICCGQCPTCRRGLTASCEQVTPRAMYGTPIGGDWGGLFSDLVRVPYADAMLTPVPEGVDPAAVASASDNLTDAWLAVGRPLAERPGAPVLIVAGAGSIGLYAIEHALAAGAGEVVYADRDEGRLALAAQLGARTIAGKDAPLGSFPVVMDASAHPAQLARALRAVAPGGICTSVGVYFVDTPVPMLDMYANDVTFRIGRPSVGPHIAAVLESARRGQIHPARVTSALFDFDDAPRVLAERSLKPVLVRPKLAR